MANIDRDAGRRKRVPARAMRPGDRVTIDGGYPEKADMVQTAAGTTKGVRHEG